MQIAQLMTRPVHTCDVQASVKRAAQIMWDHDCGVVPVLDDDGDVVGVITDRDICMAAYTQGDPLDTIPVWSAMAADVITCRPDDTIEEAQRKMAEMRVRRLPVVDDRGQLVGMLSINDVVRELAPSPRKRNASADVLQTMAAISQPRHVSMEIAEAADDGRPHARA